MAEPAYSANWNVETPQLGMPALWRLVAWGGFATVALFVAVIFSYSKAGQRQAVASPSGQVSAGRATLGQANPGAGAAQARIPEESSETAEETQPLLDAVRALTADRDQALARIAALERNLDSVTGSIKRERNTGAPPAAAPTLPQGPSAPSSAATIARPETPVARLETPAPPVTDAAVPSPAAPASQQSGDIAPLAAPDAGNRAALSVSTTRVSTPAEPLAVAAGLGVDIGGAANYAGLRTLWRSIKNSDVELPEDLYPLVTARENGKTHGVDLRLVIGPIGDVETASRVCTTLAAAHHYCQPVSFEGQRLSLNDTAPTPRAASAHAASSSAPRAVPETPHFRAVPGK
jgi:hypothetical protein